MDQSILSQLHCDGDMNYVFPRFMNLTRLSPVLRACLTKTLSPCDSAAL